MFFCRSLLEQNVPAGAAHQINFILPSKEGNGKSLANPCPCPSVGCGSPPVCGGPCKRCCPPLAEKWVKKWPSSGAFPVSGQSVGVRLSGPRKGDRRRAGVPILGAGGVSGVSRARGAAPWTERSDARTAGCSVWQSAVPPRRAHEYMAVRLCIEVRPLVPKGVFDTPL